MYQMPVLTQVAQQVQMQSPVAQRFQVRLPEL